MSNVNQVISYIWKEFLQKIYLERISHKNSKNISYNSRIKLGIILYLDTKLNYTLGLDHIILYCFQLMKSI